MPNHVLQPRKVCIASRRCTILPADIISEFIRTPARKIEGGIRHNIIRFELRVTVIEERVGIELAEVSLNTANGKVHLRHFPCSRVGVLTKDGNLVDIATVVFDEFCRLDEHAAGAAARVINAPIKRLQNFNKGSHNTGGSMASSIRTLFPFLRWQSG